MSSSLSRDATLTGLSGAFGGIATEFLFYGLDSYKVMKQANQATSFKRLFRGALPVAIIGSGPSYGAFFFCYEPLCAIFRKHLGPEHEGSSVLMASFLSGIPSSLIAIPADVLKKQIILGRESPSGANTVASSSNLNKNPPAGSRSALLTAIKAVFKRGHGIKGFFLGWRVNIIEDVAFSVVEMSFYEGFKRLYLNYKEEHLHGQGPALSWWGQQMSTRHSSHVSRQDNISNENAPVSNLGSRLVGSSDASGVPHLQPSISHAIEMKDLSDSESAGVGFLTGICTAVITCPLDCLNTRIKSGELAHLNIARAFRFMVQRDGMRSLTRGLGPRMIIIGFGSAVFWYCQSSCKHVLSSIL